MDKKNKSKSGGYLNQQERISSYIYVFLMFLIIVGSCLYFLIQQNRSLELFSRKESIVRKMEHVKSYRKVQKQNSKLCDSIFVKIRDFNPSVQASYEESDIKYLINDLKSSYIQNSKDERFKIFELLGNFYEDWLSDKKELWSLKQNIHFFKTNLEECEVGIDKKKETIKLKFRSK